MGGGRYHETAAATHTHSCSLSKNKFKRGLGSKEGVQRVWVLGCSCCCCHSCHTLSLVGVCCPPCAPNPAATVVAAAADHSLSPALDSYAPALSFICGTLPGTVAAVTIADAPLLLPLLVLPNLFTPAPVYLHTSTGTCQPVLNGPCTWLHSLALPSSHLLLSWLVFYNWYIFTYLFVHLTDSH